MRIAMESMIHDIADQEQGRKAKRHEHAGSMGLPIPVLDEIQPDAERNGAQAIQKGVQPRQEDPSLRKFGRRMVQIEQPEQESDGSGARGQDDSQCQRVVGP